MYSLSDIYYQGPINVTSTTGTYIFKDPEWKLPWGTPINFIFEYITGPTTAVEFEVTTTNSYAIITVVNPQGTPVSCSITAATGNALIYRNKQGFTW